MRWIRWYNKHVHAYMRWRIRSWLGLGDRLLWRFPAVGWTVVIASAAAWLGLIAFAAVSLR